MKKTTFLFTAAAAVLLAVSPSAKAVSPMLGLVTPADTFSFDLLAYNTAAGNGYFIAAGVPTFGVTSTYTDFDGNVVTVSSSETVGVTNTTDTFSFSTPTNFETAATINSLSITGIELDLGNANSGAATTGTANTVDTVLPIGTYTGTGTALYSTATTTKLSPGTTLSNGNMSYAAVEGLQAGTSAINQFNVRTFTYTIVYANLVPEPSTWAMCGLGLVGGAVMIRRRRLAA